MTRKLLAVAEAIVIALVILAGAIALPILCRPFYYLHIGPMNLAEQAGLSVNEVKTAYNEMMDFCTGSTDTFSAGVLHWSEEGRSHFADVRKLFILDLWVLAAACTLWVVLKVSRRKAPATLLGHTPGFWSAVGLGTLFLIIGSLAALDFAQAFVVFHKLFFPGKDNWLFYPHTDPIILILPAEFFRNCAILILAGILTGCATCLLWDKKVQKTK